jgi:hypothetical protein
LLEVVDDDEKRADKSDVEAVRVGMIKTVENLSFGCCDLWKLGSQAMVYKRSHPGTVVPNPLALAVESVDKGGKRHGECDAPKLKTAENTEAWETEHSSLVVEEGGIIEG